MLLVGGSLVLAAYVLIALTSAAALLAVALPLAWIFRFAQDRWRAR